MLKFSELKSSYAMIEVYFIRALQVDKYRYLHQSMIYDLLGWSTRDTITQIGGV